MSTFCTSSKIFVHWNVIRAKWIHARTVATVVPVGRRFLVGRRRRVIEWTFDLFTHFVANAGLQLGQQRYVAPAAAVADRVLRHTILGPFSGVVVFVLDWSIFGDVRHRAASHLELSQRKFSAGGSHFEAFVVERVADLRVRQAFLGENAADQVAVDDSEVDPIPLRTPRPRRSRPTGPVRPSQIATDLAIERRYGQEIGRYRRSAR